MNNGNNKAESLNRKRFVMFRIGSIINNGIIK